VINLVAFLYIYYSCLNKLHYITFTLQLNFGVRYGLDLFSLDLPKYLFIYFTSLVSVSSVVVTPVWWCAAMWWLCYCHQCSVC